MQRCVEQFNFNWPLFQNCLHDCAKEIHEYLTKMTIFFINVWRKIVFDIYFTVFDTALITILHIVFQYCYKYCYGDSRNLWAVMKAGGLAL